MDAPAKPRKAPEGGVLVATAFAAGGWWELMMLYSYGGEFLAGWLWGMPSAPAGGFTVTGG